MDFTLYINKLLKEKNKKYGIKKIGFIEGGSQRMMAVALKLKTLKIIEPVMLFTNKKTFQEAKLNKQLQYIIIDQEPQLQADLIKYYLDKRKDKETLLDAEKYLKKPTYFGAAMVATNKLDGAIGGVWFSSSEILRSAFKTIGAKKEVKTISSVMIMHKNETAYLWADISVNVDPTEEQLVDIAKNACQFADDLYLEKKVAFLSFSTSGSAVLSQSLKVKNATTKFNQSTKFKYKTIGEVQFDAAYDERVRKIKYKGPHNFKERPTIFIFPDLNSGNIGYKIAQRMAKWGAIGPIITGIAKPLNDLSRGATLDDIINTAILTALQTFKNN